MLRFRGKDVEREEKEEEMMTVVLSQCCVSSRKMSQWALANVENGEIY